MPLPPWPSPSDAEPYNVRMSRAAEALCQPLNLSHPRRRGLVPTVRGASRHRRRVLTLISPPKSLLPHTTTAEPLAIATEPLSIAPPSLQTSPPTAVASSFSQL